MGATVVANPSATRELFSRMTKKQLPSAQAGGSADDGVMRFPGLACFLIGRRLAVRHGDCQVLRTCAPGNPEALRHRRCIVAPIGNPSQRNGCRYIHKEKGRCGLGMEAAREWPEWDIPEHGGSAGPTVDAVGPVHIRSATRPGSRDRCRRRSAITPDTILCIAAHAHDRRRFVRGSSTRQDILPDRCR